MGDRVRTYNFAVIGSSNAAGMGASSYTADPSEQGNWTSPATSWVGMLDAYSSRINVMNFSVSGAGSNWAVQAAGTVVERYGIDAIFLCTNPISDHDDGTEYIANAHKMADICRSRDLEFIVRGAYACNQYTPKMYKNMLELNSYLGKHFKRVLDHMTCLSDEKGHFLDGDRYHTDGLHPNDAGYRALYEAAKSSRALIDLL